MKRNGSTYLQVEGVFLGALEDNSSTLYFYTHTATSMPSYAPWLPRPLIDADVEALRKIEITHSETDM